MTTIPHGDELEIALDAQVSLEWGRRLDRLSDAVERFARLANAAFQFHAIYLDASQGATATSGTPTVIKMGGPNQGRFWEVTALTVTGSDDRTVLAGTNVAFYVGNPSQAQLVDLILPGSQGGSAVTVPANAQFSRRQIIVQWPQQAYFIVYGASTGQVLTAGVQGWDNDVLDLPVRS